MHWLVSDAPLLESGPTHVKHAFVTRSSGFAFDLLVRSFPSPAVFSWPEIFQAEFVGVTTDVTHYRVDVNYSEPVTFDVVGRNGDGGSLSSTIQINVELESKFELFSK